MIKKQEIMKELWKILAISERYEDCDACALINEMVGELLNSEIKPIKNNG